MPHTTFQKPHTLRNLPNNLRFYILTSTLCLSLLLACWLRLQTPSDQLFLIRVEQVFGYAVILYWYLALIISPVAKRITNKDLANSIIFSRRAIGVSAAYFSLLHVVISFWGQIDGWSGLALLPERFVWSLTFGVTALGIIMLMAATSFDKVIRFMTPRKWKWLHRFTYLGLVLALLHLWMVGTHMVYPTFRGIIFAMLLLLAWWEAGRIAGTLGKKYQVLAAKTGLVAFGLWAGTVALLLFVPPLITNQGADHSESGSHGTQEATP